MPHQESELTQRCAAAVRQCLRAYFGLIAAQELALSLRGVDWPAFLELAARNKLTPYLSAIAARSEEPLFPLFVKDFLERRLQRQKKENALVLEEVELINAALSAQGISPLFLKGVCLSLELFRDPLVRETGDLDLLITDRDVPAAIEIIRSLGYRRVDQFLPEPATKRKWSAGLFGWDKGQTMFFHPFFRITVDLHWRVSPSDFFFFLPAAEILRNAKSINVNDQALRVLGKDDLLPYLCMEGAKEGWGLLSRLMEVAQCFQGLSAQDLRRLKHESYRWGSPKVISLAAQLVEREMGAGLLSQEFFSIFSRPKQRWIERVIGGGHTASTVQRLTKAYVLYSTLSPDGVSRVLLPVRTAGRFLGRAKKNQPLWKN